MIGGIYFLLNSPSFCNNVIPLLVNPLLAKKSSGQIVATRISELKIGRQQFKLPGNLNFEKISFVIIKDKNVYSIQIKQAKVEGVHRLMRAKKNIQIEIKGLTSDSFSETIHDADVIFKMDNSQKGLEHWQGQFYAPEAKFSEYRLRQLRSSIYADQNRMEWPDFLADFYGGKLKGKIFVDYKQGIFYSMYIALSDVDLKRLEKANPQFFSKLRGSVDGWLNIEGDSKKIRSIKALFNAPKGGKIRASFLSYLMEYIPSSTQKKDLEVLIQQDGLLPLEKASVDLKSLSDQKVLAKINLASQRFNLDINLTAEINVEGGLNNLLNSLKKIR